MFYSSRRTSALGECSHSKKVTMPKKKKRKKKESSLSQKPEEAA
jgi:hypothetical protein